MSPGTGGAQHQQPRLTATRVPRLDWWGFGETCQILDREAVARGRGRRMANNVDTSGLKVTIGGVVDHDHEGLLVLARQKAFMTPKPFLIIGAPWQDWWGFCENCHIPARRVTGPDAAVQGSLRPGGGTA